MTERTHAAPIPRSDLEAQIARRIDPEPFERQGTGRELFDDRRRRRSAIRAAMRVSDLIEQAYGRR